MYRNNLSRVNGARGTSFAGGHIPFWEGKTAVGLNLLQDNFNLASNVFVMPSFAYHLRFNNSTALSFGLGGEFSHMRFDGARVNYDYTSDELANLVFNDPISLLDFSTGINFSTRYFNVGASANRMSSIFNLRKEFSTAANEFYKFYSAFFIPVRSGIDMLEPIVSFRYLPTPIESTIPIRQTDIGLYYTYNNLITVGANYGLGNSEIGGYVEGRFQDFALGFAYSNIGSNVAGSALGSNFEVNLRFDFNATSYQSKIAGAGSRVNIRAVSAQRKAMGSSRTRPASFKNYRSKGPTFKTKNSFAKKSRKISNKKRRRGKSYSKYYKTSNSKYTRKKQLNRRKRAKKMSKRKFKPNKRKRSQYRKPGSLGYKLFGPRRRR